MLQHNPFHRPPGPPSTELNPRPSAGSATASLTGDREATVVVRRVPGSGPSCDFLYLTPQPEGALTLALGTIDGPFPQTRRAWAMAIRSFGVSDRRHDSPARALSRLHSILSNWNDRLAEPLTCSAVCCLFDFARGVIRYANADHPCPLAWNPDGFRTELRHAGEVLGLSFLPERHRHRRSDELCIEEWSIALDDVQRIVCYSDGLLGPPTTSIERRRRRHSLDVMDVRSVFPLEEHLETMVATALFRRENPLPSPADMTLVGADLRTLAH